MSVESDSSGNVEELKHREQVEPIASFLKMKLLELTPGCARVSIRLRPEYQNFNGTVSGSIIMAVADQAFAYASNSLALPSLACQFSIYFIAGPGANDELIAECRVVKGGRRVAVSEMTVTNQAGKLIARAIGQTIPIG